MPVQESLHLLQSMVWPCPEIRFSQTSQTQTLEKQGGREDRAMNATSSGDKSSYVVCGVTSKMNSVIFRYFLMHLCPPQRPTPFVTTVNNCSAEVQELNGEGITRQVWNMLAKV